MRRHRRRICGCLFQDHQELQVVDARADFGRPEVREQPDRIGRYRYSFLKDSSLHHKRSTIQLAAPDAGARLFSSARRGVHCTQTLRAHAGPPGEKISENAD